jgi:RNA polymerase sigma-70 factor (ECF subfamily)
MKDNMLVILAKEGQHGAFRQLYEQNWGRIYRIAFRHTGSQPDAEDIMQETFIKVFKRIHTLRTQNEADFSAWLNTICLNCVIDFLRKQGRRQRNRQVSLSDLPRELLSNNPSPEHKVLMGQAAGRIREILGILSPRQRLIFDMRYNQHMDIKDIAECLRCSTSNVKTQIFRSLKKLRKTLEPVWGKP